MGGIKLHIEKVISIYQWPATLQHLFQKQFYISDSVCSSITQTTGIVHILNPS